LFYQSPILPWAEAGLATKTDFSSLKLIVKTALKPKLLQLKRSLFALEKYVL
jgi:hypothetical protein